jgi:hypothetical protein
MLEEQVAQLMAERDIRNVLMRYCRGVDRCDQELIASCFHDDAADDHGNWQAQGRGIAERIVGLVKPGSARAMHFLGNVTIEVEGTSAFAESYVLAFRTLERDGKAYTRTRAVRFVDRFSLRSGQWRISERVVVDEWNRVDQVVEAQEGLHGCRFSSKDKDDPVYRIRAGRLARSAP